MLEFLRGLAANPSAPPVPPGWPHGWLGVLLLFCIPGGLGIPSGVLLARDDGLGAGLMTVLYFASDVLLALAIEPLLIGLARASRYVSAVERFGRAMMIAMTRLMPPGSLLGSTGIVLTGFGAGLPFGRTLAAGAHYGLVSGWLLTIAGDMLYFVLGMVSTLWFGAVLGDQRLAVLAALVVMLVVSMAVRRVRPTPD
jgi:hypothetical protein